MKRALFLILFALVALSYLIGCGVDQRVVRGHDTTDNALKKADDNHAALHAEERKLLREEAEGRIDDRYEWHVERIQTQAANNLQIGAPQIIAEMKRLTYKRDEQRAAVNTTIRKLEALQSIPENDIAAARKINAKLKEYAAEPGFDFIALMQGFLNKKEEPLPQASMQTMQIPVMSMPLRGAPVIEEK